MFDPIVNYIVELVKEQYKAVEKRGGKVAVGFRSVLVSMEKV
jgi:hypothetical protein